MARRKQNIEVDLIQTEAYQKRFGGKKRSDLKDSEFLFPKDKSFPITSPDSIHKALKDYGRSPHGLSYQEFVSKLHRFVKTHHPEWGLKGWPDKTVKEHKLK